MQDKFRREISRKALHLTGITILVVYYYLGKEFALLYTSAALLVFLGLEFIRIRANKLFPLERATEYIQRKGEGNALAATVYFCVAAIATIFFFDERSVIVGLSVALLSDMAAALVGIGVGKHRIMEEKTLEGSIAGIAMAMGVAFLLNAGIITILALGAVFLVLDLVDLGIDDNFTIPLAMVAVVYLIEVFI
jgi:dolichol kinase